VVVNITTSSSAQAVEVHAFERTARAYALGPGRWQALVGVDLDEEPGAYVLSAVVDGNGRAGERSIEVESRTFPVRRLTVNPDFVNPPASVQSRIADDARLLARIYANPASERLWGGGFRRPVPHRANSRFGTRSVFNGEPRNPHTGTDFLSPAGTPILAPQAGRAVAARDLYFSGNTVVLDHGLGLFSQLAHMSRIDVKEGAMVTTGQRLGLVGATGRVTGAHLHWGMRLNGARVDPLSLVALLPMDATP
ncbi:MAG: M23 family metallopeptidase, partial [Acidobacteriota bacterium]|nr:M23 family metallopeptidase [Acidobacteriota bacterium]